MLKRPTAAWFGQRAHHPFVAGLTVFLGLEAGGYFPGATGIATVAVAIFLLLRMLLADRPFAGWSVAGGVAVGALTLLATWTLLSSSWSGSAERALLEFDRTLLYVLVLALFATYVREPGGVSVTLRWLVLAASIVAAAGLAARLAPDVSGLTEPVSPERLSYPLTYWNAMGIFCAVGALLAFHVASAAREPLAVRVLATMAVAPLALAGYFTFSRGAIAAAGLGLVVYLVAARPRGALFALATAVPAAAVAIHAAYGADLLGTTTYDAGDGPAQGHRVAVILLIAVVAAGGVRLLLAPLERRFEAARLLPRPPRPLVTAAVAALAVVLLAAGLVAAGLPDRVRSEMDAFAKGNVVAETGDARDRLSARGNNGRLDFWRVAIDVGDDEPWIGTGAGTFRTEWFQRRPDGTVLVGDAHSLFLEMRAELGVIGLALIVVVLAMLLGAAVARLRGPDRQAAAAVLAAALALLAHAAIDWDWEMPVLFVWLFATGGLLLAGDGRRAAHEPRRLTRIVAGIGCLLLMITPTLVVRSQAALDRSTAAVARGDCGTAIDEALASLDALRLRAEPFEWLGWCDIRAGQHRLAVGAMRAAEVRDPDNWQYPYGLAVAKAFAGEDPRPSVRRAVQLNPRDEQTERLRLAFRGDDPAAWKRRAARLPIPVDR
jgi:hypothetical protein